MFGWRQLRRRFRALVDRGTLERDLDDELRFHLEMETEMNIRNGMSPDDARRAAERSFGGMARIRDETRDRRGVSLVEDLGRDVRVAVRGLRRTPGFAAIAVLTLALGIGANTAIFSVVNGVILKPLPYPHGDRLVMITSQFPSMGFDQFWVSAPEFLELRDRAHSFQDIGAYTTTATNIGASGQPARVTAAVVSASLFPVLGVTPRLGQTFTADQTLPNAEPVVVLSSEIWQSAFGGLSSIVGQQVEIDGLKRTVVGVMPAGFDVHDEGIKIWLPLLIDPGDRKASRARHYLYLIGRLKPSVALTQARAELETLLAQWPAASGAAPNAKPGDAGFVHTPNATGHRLRFDDLQSDVIGSVRRALWLLQAAVAFVLLIACANMANLLLMRAESRHKELAVRVALGAGQGRLVRQFIAEGVVLSVSGGMFGLLLAYWGVHVMLAASGGSIPRATDVGIDPRVLIITLIVAVGTGVVFGMAPMLHLGARTIGVTLRDGGSRTTSNAARHRVRRGLVVAEMALAVVLVVGAGLLMRSFWNLTRVSSGFDRANLTTFGLVLPRATYRDSTQLTAFWQRLTAQLDAIPGVTSAAAMSGLPPQRQVNANDTDFEGIAMTKTGPNQNIDYYQYVTPAYVTTMGIPVVSGRSFTESDGPTAPPVALINEVTAKLFYPNMNPVGRRIRPSGNPVWFTIVGIVKNVKQGGLDAKTGTELYLDVPQMPLDLGYGPANMNVVIRSKLPPSALASSIRRTVSALDPALPIVDLRSMNDVFAESLGRARFLTLLLGIFAAVALTLAAIGTYGVLAYTVTERGREIGIRMALGANRGGVVGMVLRQGVGLASIGIVVGVAGAVGVTRIASSLLFEVGPTDPVTFISVSVFMVVVSALACVVPARRATRVDPLVALRID